MEPSTPEGVEHRGELVVVDVPERDGTFDAGRR